MRIGIDARFLTHPQLGGFKTYTESLIAALAEIDADNEYILYLDRPPDAESKIPNRPNFSAQIVPGILPIIGTSWREQVGLARQIRREHLDLFHSPNLTAPLLHGCPLVVTIHDMIWYFRDRFSRGNYSSARRRLMEWYYRWVPQYAVKYASAIITVSHTAKESIVEHLKLDSSRIFVTHEAASPLFRRIDDAERIEAVRNKYQLPAQFIMGIGSADPRKNIKTLVQAYALLSCELRARYRLAIVWTDSLLAPNLKTQIESLGLTDSTHFLERVPNEDLMLIYNSAALFVFPSLYEGFGLPPLEAMACGTPVVAADNSSIPEIVGDAALLFDAQDAGTMAGVMGRVLTDETYREVLINRGTKRATSFSWKQCARQTLATYRFALGKSADGDIVNAHSF